MIEKTLVIKFLTPWHVSSGLGDGYWADSVLRRDNDGFPYIPGRALKGALREGARIISQCSGRDDLTYISKVIFGSDISKNEKSKEGLINFSSAYLNYEIKCALEGDDKNSIYKEEYIRDLLCYRTQIKLDENGITENGSLRTIECGIPYLTFEAELEIKENIIKSSQGITFSESWINQYLECVIAACKSIGADRARGLGKCEITFKGSKHKEVSLPPKKEVAHEIN
ncbi:MAG: RAMP superfamily CRISPR-associated protein [Succinivibrionaceae bacterium]|nr:RAMP superfamily CRISPR-associated protein [Succinivibrionaceae bacterium]